MNCIIVDDDSISCKILEGYVEKYPDLQLVGTFTSSFEARNAIIQHSDIELIFLDIMMPEMNGFDFLESLEYPPHIIIVSATEEYAIKAFDYNVTDYLLKPINYGRFCKAVDKIFRYFVKKDPSKSGDKELFIKNGSSLVKL
ncbi:MAG: response regulator, partial [Bacteroidales bacterium]|nr:response regulator [Bacteroidales bacterium]